MDEWQPIETAPRDGTQILVLVASPYEKGRSTYHLVCWYKGRESTGERDPGADPCWSANENGARYFEPEVQKWMPLPERVPLADVPMIDLAERQSFGIQAFKAA